MPLCRYCRSEAATNLSDPDKPQMEPGETCDRCDYHRPHTEVPEEIAGTIPKIHHDAETDTVTIYAPPKMPLPTIKSLIEDVSDRYPNGTEFHVVKHIKGLPKQITVDV